MRDFEIAKLLIITYYYNNLKCLIPCGPEGPLSPFSPAGPGGPALPGGPCTLTPIR